MHLDESETDLLKTWIIQKLEHISDADSDVLADYVLALVKTDDPVHVAKSTCVENLHDFLSDSSQAFVDDLFAAIDTRAYDPVRLRAGHSVPPSHSSLSVSAQGSHRTNHQYQRQGSPVQQYRAPRKRTYHDWDRDDTTPSSVAHDRPVKQVRRGGRGASEQWAGRREGVNIGIAGAPPYMHQFQQGLPPMPSPPPGMPPFDPNNPMASLLALQQVMGMLSSLPLPAPSMAAEELGTARSTGRCRDYDNKGFCARGAACPFEHGADPYLVPDVAEYDPTQVNTLDLQPSRVGVVSTGKNERARGGLRGRGRSNTKLRGGGSKRANFSHQGPVHDRSYTTIVVEQIPEDKFNEETVRRFFAEFGSIAQVTMQPYKRLAIVVYDDHDAAQAAYDSPRVVFENRFVKVYWYRPENLPRPPNNHPASSISNHPAADEIRVPDTTIQLDPEEIAKKQDEAQRRHDEVQKQRQEQQKHRQELDAKIKAVEAESRAMAAKIARKTGIEVLPASTLR